MSERSGSGEREQTNRILLVEDHRSFRQMLAYVLEREPEFEVIAQAGSLSEARQLPEESKNRVDLAVLDLTLPDGEGTELIGELRSGNPHFAALVLTASLDRSEVARAVEAGAAGVLHKSAGIEEIISGVHRTLAGESLLSPEEISALLDLAVRDRKQEHETRDGIERLTRREKQILQALAEGLNGREIAHRLGISAETERSHMVNIFSKLGANSRLQALVLAARYGIVKLR